MNERGWSEQPRSPDVKPDALMGSIVQIVVDTEMIGPPIVLPPVITRGLVLPEDHYASIRGKTNRARIEPIFFGTPLHDLEICESEERCHGDIVGIRFYSLIPELEPHYLLDRDFLAYFRTHEYESILVRVWILRTAKDSEGRDSQRDDNYVLLGDGTLQLYIPGTGYSRSWSPGATFAHELNATEKTLLSKFPSKEAVRRYIEQHPH